MFFCFFFKQRTAYEVRMRDWSSDVCSSDLIKSRRPQGQLIAILSDRVPTSNLAQIQCGMVVAGRKWCDYVSYSAGLPLYVKRVWFDPDWFAAIEAAATAFEVNVTDTINRYTTRTQGLAPTDRRPDLADLRT